LILAVAIDQNGDPTRSLDSDCLCKLLWPPQETVGALPLTALSFPPWFPDAWQTCKAGKLAGGLKLGGARLIDRSASALSLLKAYPGCFFE
jgi:hypothetical protein